MERDSYIESYREAYKRGFNDRTRHHVNVASMASNDAAEAHGYWMGFNRMPSLYPEHHGREEGK